MSDLNIPEEAIEAAARALASNDPGRPNTLDRGTAATTLREGGPLIVAAELDRLIVMLDAEAERNGKRAGVHAQGTENGLQMAGTWLYRRAAELRGGDTGSSRA